MATLTLSLFLPEVIDNIAQDLKYKFPKISAL